MLEVIPYTSDKVTSWDSFIEMSKNGHFMFLRKYMDYHAHKFNDYSFLFYENEELIAVLPGSRFENNMISHGGLTFGGLILGKKIKSMQVIQLFATLVAYLKQEGIVTLKYKAIPYIYHSIPSEEDLYALFLSDAQLIRRDISSTIFLRNKLGFSGGKKNGVAKAKKNQVNFKESNDYIKFNAIVNEVLTQKYKTSSTHDSSEMRLLADRFPKNIKLYGAFINEQMVAGALIYISQHVAHSQYLATTERGREVGALDLLLDKLINEVFTDQLYFDFGISTEQQGRYLNEGLISQKEMFGARGITYDTYEIKF